MKEKTIICPSCGAVITLDDATYAEIINQVKTAEVDREVSRRMEELKKLHEAEEAARITEESARHREELSGKDKEIERLRQLIDGWEEKKALEIETLNLKAREAAAEELRDKEKELLKKGDITLEMSDYAGFEKGAPLPEELPQNNEPMNTDAGDIILYQGRQFVIYYDTNSWSLTPLGKVQGISKDDLKSLLGTGNIAAVLSLSGDGK